MPKWQFQGLILWLNSGPKNDSVWCFLELNFQWCIPHTWLEEIMGWQKFIIKDLRWIEPQISQQGINLKLTAINGGFLRNIFSSNVSFDTLLIHYYRKILQTGHFVSQTSPQDKHLQKQERITLHRGATLQERLILKKGISIDILSVT